MMFILLVEVDPFNCLSLYRIAKLCDGTRSLEDLAVIFAVSPVKLLDAIRADGNFVSITK